MNKRSLLPVLSTALLAPAFLAGQVYAEEATTPAESSAVVATPATSATPAPDYKMNDRFFSKDWATYDGNIKDFQ